MPVEEYENKAPICPHCAARITTTRDMRLGTSKIFYLCPKCGKVLSIGKD
ncbi:MAG: hypothetical protein HY365_03270 [Candidatus Aenigmarchaeota archaeon]|nr:hypothetical protein [Candidatus Aenigmarchaeota archaeon]